MDPSIPVSKAVSDPHKWSFLVSLVFFG